MAANKALILELNENADPKQYTCAAGVSISKGDLLKISGANTVVAFDIGDDDDPVAGNAAADKDGTDSSTTIAVYTPQQGNKFSMTSGVAAVTIGAEVAVSGGNLIRDAVAADAYQGKIIGKAMSGGAAQQIVVLS